MNAEIVSTGTELLLGKNCNEDARIICEVLARCGIDIYRYTTVGDNVNRVAQAYSEALKRSNIVISTGGLGGTDDDVSKQAASLATSVPLETNERIKDFLKEKKVLSKRIVESFSSIPANSILFENTVGVAPGIVISLNGKYLILLPGPPSELKSILKNGLEVFLRKLGGAFISNEVIRVYGMRESEVEEMIHDLTFSSNPTLATFLKKGWIEISITAKAKDKPLADELISKVKEKILKRFPKEKIGKVDEMLEEGLCHLFSEKKLTLSVAESITGGMISSKIVNVPGASSVFMGGIVSYSNESKVKMLGVSNDTLEEHGAVSEKCVMEMAIGAKKLFGTKVSVATTGIAGPTGGTEKKPVGTVWSAICFGKNVKTWKHVYAGSRNEIRKMASEDALEFLLRNVPKKA